MTQRKQRDELNSSQPERHDDMFYEAMPLTGMPHSIFSDNTAHPDESFEAADIATAKRNLTTLITLALVLVVVAIMVTVVVYGFLTMGDSTAANSLSSGSLDL